MICFIEPVIRPLHRLGGKPAVVLGLLLAVLLSIGSVYAQAPAGPIDPPEADQSEPEEPAGDSPSGDAESQEPAEQDQPDEDLVERPALPYTELPIGAAIDGETSQANPANYSFVVDSPGVLTLIVRSKNDHVDLVLQLMDDEGGTLAESDIDFANNMGSEQLCVSVPAAGRYRVTVYPHDVGGGFWIGSSWIAYEGAAGAGPSKPSEATELTPGVAQTCDVNGNNPPNAWFKYTADKKGLLVFKVQASPEVDLFLQQFDEAVGFNEPVQYVDGDRRGNLSNEMIAAEVEPGQTVYFSINPHEVGPAARIDVEAKLYVEPGVDQ